MAAPQDFSDLRAAPMHAHDRRLLAAFNWAGNIGGALAAGCYIAWASNQMPFLFATIGMAIGLLAMTSATIYAFGERTPAKRGYFSSIIFVAIALTWAVCGWQTWMWFHPSLPPLDQTRNYTQAQLEFVKAKAVEAATGPIQDKLDQANKDNEALRQTAKQLADAKASAQSPQQSDTPISVSKVPTSLKLLFKAGTIEEISSQNVIWTKVVASHEEKTSTLLGDRSNTFPVWAVIIIFKKPITFTKIDSDDHGAGLPVPTMSSSSSRYAVLEFGTNVFSYSFQNVLVDITVK